MSPRTWAAFAEPRDGHAMSALALCDGHTMATRTLRDGSSIASRMLVGIPPALPIGRRPHPPPAVRFCHGTTRRSAEIPHSSHQTHQYSAVLRAARPGQGDAGHPRGVCGGILTGHRTVRRVRRTRRQEHRPWPAGRVEPASPELAAVHRPMPPYGRQRPCERGPQDARPRTGSHGNGAREWRMGTARGDGATVTGRRAREPVPGGTRSRARRAGVADRAAESGDPASLTRETGSWSCGAKEN